MDPDPDAYPDPAIFVIDLQIAQKSYFLSVFAYYFLKVQLHQDKKSKRNHKAVGIKVFLTIFAW
jgi:hypothetical protein